MTFGLTDIHTFICSHAIWMHRHLCWLHVSVESVSMQMCDTCVGFYMFWVHFLYTSVMIRD